MYNPTWLTIPAGPFLMGSDPRAAAPPLANEQPQQRLWLPEFCLSRTPVTNAHYQCFVAATQHRGIGQGVNYRLEANNYPSPM